MARARGMTLLEIMIAMAIFSILGMTLALFLRQGLSAWRTGEARRGAYEEAQSLLRRLREDLRSTFTTVPVVPGEPARARFLCDIDEEGRQRLAFVRTIPAESRHPLAALAGNAIGADQDLDGRNDHEKAVAGRLRATGGLEEVLYAMDPEVDGALLRGARSPVGGDASLFALENVKNAARLREVARPLSLNVLHFELQFWAQNTEGWRDEAVARKHGPTSVWDSTRGLLPADPNTPAEEFRFFRDEASVEDADDDVFPERIRATIVVREEGPAATWSALAAPVNETDVEVAVLDPKLFETRGPYVRIGKGQAAEWVRFKSVDAGSGRLRLEVNGRGLRGTRRRRHAAGEDVVTGRTFTTEVEVPAFAEAWNE
jgi:prepilin-type N-terminal cleavage/methylation domain-containing protein